MLANSLTYACTAGVAQVVKVSGLVLDEDGNPVIGATVKQMDGSVGTVTDVNGNYSLEVPIGSKLIISYVGFESLTVKANKNLKSVMHQSKETLNEVVVVGYGTQKKANLTGAVDQVTSKTFDGRANATAVQMLQGTIPNLNISFTDGKPNRQATLNIRGTTSIGQGGSALVLIDGVEGDLAMLNPDDIESVSVLKDAASSAIYGSRAPYGVILVTTKTAKKGRLSVNYSTNLTLQKPTNMPDYVSDGYTYAEHFYLSYHNFHHSNPSNMNTTQQFSTAWLEEYKKRKESGNFGTEVSDGSDGLTPGRWVYYNKETDYYDLLFKDNDFTQTHNLSISGADDKFEFYLSGRYYRDNGLYDSHSVKERYELYNTRLKTGYQALPWLKITNNIEISKSKYQTPLADMFLNIYRAIGDEGHPSSPIWNPDGTMTYSAVKTIGDFLYGKSSRTDEKDFVQDTFGFKTNFFNNSFHIICDFTYRNENGSRTMKHVRTPFSMTKDVIETVPGTQSSLQEAPSKKIYISTNDYAEYENTFAEKHYFKALIGFNYEQEQEKGLSAYNTDLLTDDAENINLALGTDNKSINGSWYKWRSAGFFYRLNYIFKNRYLIETNGRYDGSSKFPDGQRWGFFPSVSGGWRISAEPWFKVSPNIIDNLKLRVSYGTLGNSNVEPYSYGEKFAINRGRILGGTSAFYTSAPAPIPSGLTWERAGMLDFGLDMGLFNNQLNITADWYDRCTSDMYTVGVSLPDVFGADSPKGNNATMYTKGYEISVSWNSKFTLADKPFHYYVKATLADYKSKITKYNNATKALGTGNSPQYYKGMTIGEIWGYECNGLYQTQEEIDADEAKAKAAGQAHFNTIFQCSSNYALYPGDIKITDLNGNGYIDRGSNTKDDPGDRRIIGNSEPRYIYSFSFGADWNNIFFNVFFRGVGKQDWYPGQDSGNFWGQYNRPYNQMCAWMIGNYWTEDNPNAYLPRYTGYYGPFRRSIANTRYMQNVAYLRMQNLQIGYILPTAWTNRFGVRQIKIFITGENLFTWSPLYKRSKDVDVTNIYGSDYDYYAHDGDGYNYPTKKSISIGLNVKF
ncbi:MAG: SusC/RagA family TonB-linked outer membrane protein [Prevotella sp.]